MPQSRYFGIDLMIVSTNIAKASASDPPIVGSIMFFLGDLGNIWKPMAWCYDVLW